MMMTCEDVNISFDKASDAFPNDSFVKLETDEEANELDAFEIVDEDALLDLGSLFRVPASACLIPICGNANFATINRANVGSKHVVQSIRGPRQVSKLIFLLIKRSKNVLKKISSTFFLVKQNQKGPTTKFPIF